MTRPNSEVSFFSKWPFYLAFKEKRVPLFMTSFCLQWPFQAENQHHNDIGQGTVRLMLLFIFILTIFII